MPLQVGVEVCGSDAEMMKAGAAFLEHLAIHRRRVVIRLDELDIHVSGKAHRQRDFGARGLAAIQRRLAGELGEQKPRPDLELPDPVVHRRMDVFDHVCHLDDAVIGLAERYETHAQAPWVLVTWPRDTTRLRCDQPRLKSTPTGEPVP
jgi:hypothetical protein